MSDYNEFYEKSMKALTEYIENNKEIPTEKVWNRLAVEEYYLSSQTIGYLTGIKFPDLCKKLYKEAQKKKKGELKNEYMA